MIRLCGLDMPKKPNQNHEITPSLRDGLIFVAFPGSKLPGYDRSVSAGQKQRDHKSTSVGGGRTWPVLLGHFRATAG